MSASSCVVYYGLRIPIEEDEIERLELRTDSRIKLAKAAGLQHYWGNFGAPGELYFLFVGAEIGVLGPENDLELILPFKELKTVVKSTKKKLKSVGFGDEPSLYIQWEQDV